VADPSNVDAAEAALAVLEVSGELGLSVDVERAQEQVYALLHHREATPALGELADKLSLSPRPTA
jgi:hypothetical protein